MYRSLILKPTNIMSTETTTEKRTVNSKVEQVDINLDEIFAAAPGAAEVITQDEKPAQSIFSRGEKADMSFADPDVNDTDDLNSKVEAEDTTIETVDEEGKEKEVEKIDIDDEAVTISWYAKMIQVRTYRVDPWMLLGETPRDADDS